MPDEDNDEMPQHPFLHFFRMAPPPDPKVVEEARYGRDKSYLSPSWREVTHKDGIPKHFMQWAINAASHASQCTDPACNFCQGRRISFCSPDLFVKFVQDRLRTFTGIPESNDMAELWGTRDLKAVEVDPRYIIFRCNWDEVVVATAVVRECMQDVYRAQGIELD